VLIVSASVPLVRRFLPFSFALPFAVRGLHFVRIAGVSHWCGAGSVLWAVWGRAGHPRGARARSYAAEGVRAGAVAVRQSRFAVLAASVSALPQILPSSFDPAVRFFLSLCACRCRCRSGENVLRAVSAHLCPHTRTRRRCARVGWAAPTCHCWGYTTTWALWAFFCGAGDVSRGLM
jgi:hypothetical protein